MSEEEYESQIRTEYIYMLDKQQEEIERLRGQLNRIKNILDNQINYREEIDVIVAIEEVISNE